VLVVVLYNKLDLSGVCKHLPMLHYMYTYTYILAKEAWPLSYVEQSNYIGHSPQEKIFDLTMTNQPTSST
jgi:hypothetical protein